MCAVRKANGRGAEGDFICVRAREKDEEDREKKTRGEGRERGTSLTCRGLPMHSSVDGDKARDGAVS